ncbi:MAG: hypothetical protein ABGY10_05460 [bacterium]|nr:hypothetical protein [Gemmatimonadota bacterium]HIL88894.1 hypothetical protein [Gemmatimonadota bacterium]
MIHQPEGLLRRSVSWVIGVGILVATLFAILVRGSVFSYHTWAFGASLSLVCAVVMTVPLLLLGAWVIIPGSGIVRRVQRMLIRGTLMIAFIYMGYAVLYVASTNAVPDEIREEYQMIHPLLRLAASPVIVLDPSAFRPPDESMLEDYRLMGLSANEANLHFVQTDDLIHSLDLVTDNRSEWRNRAIELGFWAFGFHSLRLLGVGDHLHVSLRLPG